MLEEDADFLRPEADDDLALALAVAGTGASESSESESSSIVRSTTTDDLGAPAKVMSGRRRRECELYEEEQRDCVVEKVWGDLPIVSTKV